MNINRRCTICFYVSLLLAPCLGYFICPKVKMHAVHVMMIIAAASFLVLLSLIILIPKMTTRPKPVSGILRGLAVENFRHTKTNSVVTGFDIGDEPGEIIIRTTDGPVLCQILEDGKFVHLILPNEKQKVPRNHFLSTVFRQPA